MGVDLCSVERMTAMLGRRPGVVKRLFTRRESHTERGLRTAQSLAARFAAKEALAKAIGVPNGGSWLDIEVIADESGRPCLTLSGAMAVQAASLGVARVHVSLSHDGGMAIAMVVCEA